MPVFIFIYFFLMLEYETITMYESCNKYEDYISNDLIYLPDEFFGMTFLCGLLTNELWGCLMYAWMVNRGMFWS